MDGEGMGELSVTVLKTALAIEEFGIRFYADLGQCVADPRGAALMRSLGNDEGEHARIIQREMDRLMERGDQGRIEPLKEYLRILPEMVFERPIEGCIALNDEIAALQKGIEVEVNSIKMYQEALAKALDAKTHATLQELARWELRHREILEENLRTLKLEGAWYGYGPILEG